MFRAVSCTLAQTWKSPNACPSTDKEFMVYGASEVEQWQVIILHVTDLDSSLTFHMATEHYY